VVRVDAADLVRPPHEDARRLRVIDLVEDEVGWVLEMEEPKAASQCRHGDHGHDGSVQPRQERHRPRVPAHPWLDVVEPRHGSRQVDRSRVRTTNCSPWYVSVIDALLLSTSSASNPTRWTASKSRSVRTPAAFFGHAIHRRPAGVSDRASAGKAAVRSDRRVTNVIATSTLRPGRRRNSTPPGIGARRWSSSANPAGAGGPGTRAAPRRAPPPPRRGAPEAL